MPGKDGTGPVGAGTMNGRDLGAGQRMKPGYGCRRGIADATITPLSPEEDKALLDKQVHYLKQRIKDLENQK